jgi:hypothetical protein
VQQRKAAATQDAVRERTRASVASGLSEVLHGLEIVDRDLELEPGRAADLVGVDGGGRLVLVLMVDGDADATALAALDAVAHAQRNVGVLAQHLQVTRLRAEQAALVVLVTERFGERTLGRCAALDPELVRLFELRRVASARGENVYLAPVLPISWRAADAGSRSSEVFLESLAAAQREIAELLVKRVAHIDDQLVLDATERSLSWRLKNELVACLLAVEDRLEGQVPPDARPKRIAHKSEVESFVDETSRRYVELLNATTGTPTLPALVEPSGDPRALLSKEEIEAFRQPG